MAVDPLFENTSCVDLLANEGNEFMYIDGVTTMTFFNGEVPADAVKNRLVEIVQASPWVGGKLARSKARIGRH